MSTLTPSEPAFVTLLRELRTLAQNKTAIHGLVQNEIDTRIEDFLVDYGFDPAGEVESGYREPMRDVRVKVDWVVAAGSGHGGPRRFDHEDEARGYYDQQAEINSYIGTGKQHASIHRETIIVDRVTRNR